MKFRYLKDVVTLELAQDKCTGCGICIEVCPQAVFVVENRKASIADRDACIECGACAKNCAFSAISVKSGAGCASAIISGLFNGGEPCCGGKGSCSCG